MWQIRRASSFRPIPMVWVCPPHLGLSVDPSITLVETQKMELRRPPSLPLYLLVLWLYWCTSYIFYIVLMYPFPSSVSFGKERSEHGSKYINPNFRCVSKIMAEIGLKVIISLPFLTGEQKINSTNKKLLFCSKNVVEIWFRVVKSLLSKAIALLTFHIKIDLLTWSLARVIRCHAHILSNGMMTHIL